MINTVIMVPVVGYYGGTLLTPGTGSITSFYSTLVKAGSSGSTSVKMNPASERHYYYLVPQDLTLSLVSFHEEL